MLNVIMLIAIMPNVVMLIAIMPNVVMLSVIIQNAVLLSAIMPSVVMLSVMAPRNGHLIMATNVCGLEFTKPLAIIPKLEFTNRFFDHS